MFLYTLLTQYTMYIYDIYNIQYNIHYTQHIILNVNFNGKGNMDTRQGTVHCLSVCPKIPSQSISKANFLFCFFPFSAWLMAILG